MLELTQVSVRHKHQLGKKQWEWAQRLKHVSLTLKPGKMLGIIGPNGAGKSSLLAAMSGEVEPTSGAVKLDGELLQHYPLQELAQRRALMPQQLELAFEFKVWQVVAMGMALYAPNVLANDARLQTYLQWLDVVHLSHHSIRRLSGGEKQRVHLARIFAQLQLADRQSSSTDMYLLMDEWTTHLDLAHQHRTFQRLQQWVQQQSLSVVMVLHDLHLAAQYCDQLVLMHQGELVKEGTPASVLDPNVLSDVYQWPLQQLPHPDGWPLVVTRKTL